jgi:dTDP-4-amino-4,6-dideoxygalactose transaminase
MTASNTTDRLALLGGTPVREPTTPAFPTFTEQARKRVDELLAAGHAMALSKHDPIVEEAESAIAAWQGTSHCLTVSSGHAALQAALIGLEVTSGDEVIVSPYTWGASISCILHNNAIPMFADVDPATGLLDPADVEERITPRTRAILVPHIFGQPANMTALREIADRHGLVIVEDGSQAHGARHAGRQVGTFGDAAGFSCMGGKLLAATEAGYLVTDRPEVYYKAVLAGQHAGMAGGPGRVTEPGFPPELLEFSDSLIYTHRVSSVAAVLLVEQLKKLDTENEGRRANLARLRENLTEVSCISFPDYPDGDLVAPHILTMSFDAAEAGIPKETFIAALRAEGVPAFAYVKTPLHRLERLKADTRAPRVMWTENLERAGVDYASLELPGTEAKVAASIELSWNYVTDDAAAMDALAGAFTKVHAHLDDLREHERREGIPRA